MRTGLRMTAARPAIVVRSSARVGAPRRRPQPRPPVVSDRVEEVILEEPERTVLGLAQPPARLDDLVENRLHACGAGCRTQHRADRLPLLLQVLELAGELGASAVTSAMRAA